MAPIPIYIQDDNGDLYDECGRYIAWFEVGVIDRVFIEGERTVDELRAIADWLEERQNV